jgi:uncharacterized protein YjbI with pentapeptide repeats
VKPDLSFSGLAGQDFWEACLTGADLSFSLLRYSSLHNADLSEANLEQADLMETELCGAHLRGARLVGAMIVWSDLAGADLRSASMNLAHIVDSNVAGTDLTGVSLYETLFAGVDLSSVIGLETCKFHGHCTVDHRTVEKSKHLPRSFLRGCGLPDVLIESFRSLSTAQSQSCFISHSTKDCNFADQLHADLQNEGVRCWFAPHDIKAGRKLHEQIDEAVRLYDRVLLILSEHSMNSEWVKTEIAHARQKELNESRQVLFPISLVPFPRIRGWKCFDVDTGKDSAREVREYFIPDFSNWRDHDSYQAAFQRLVRDLKAKESGSADVR